MKWTRRSLSFGLALALSVMVSCTSADSPTAPELSQSPEQSSELLGSLLGGDLLGDDLLSGDGLIGDVLDGTVGTLLNVTDLLVCSSQPYEIARQTIGFEGGTIQVGSHSLVIPRGALRRQTT